MSTKHSELFRRYLSPIILVTLLYGLEIIVSAPFFGIIVAGILIIFLLYCALYRIANGSWTKAIESRIKIYIFSCFVVLSTGTFFANYFYMHNQTKRLISAICNYKQDKGKYPKSLEDIVPKYIPTIPKSKWFYLMSNEYLYFSQDDEHSLIWHPTNESESYWFEREGCH